MLRKLRLTVAILAFLAVMLLFLDFTGTLHGWLGWMAKLQFVPAVLALNVAVVVALVIVTLVFGRVYCSVICPLGIMQDIIAWFEKRGKKLPYAYSPAKSWLRYVMLAVFVVACVAGVGSLAALLDPYASFGRIANGFLQPLYQWGNNLLAYFAERADSYAFYSVEVWLKSLPTLIIAGAVFVFVFVLAWRNGRTYCNTVCPVGTVLGFISRFSLMKITIDEEKCVGCHLCARKCKAACIDSKNHKIDYSRCVDCFDCIDSCTHDAIAFRVAKRPAVQTGAKEKVDGSRRMFLTSAAAVTATGLIKAQEKKVDGGLAVIEDKKIPERATRITPPGSLGTRHFYQHCTACQLCVSVCPNQVLRPSGGLLTLMQPEMSYERGYCRPECVKCSEVCPAGAIKPISKEEKTAIQIGHAVWIKANCVVETDGVECGNCARHCPSGAIQMVPEDASNPDSLKIPAVNVERCIGCGACENLCPARPFSAIFVEGHERHRTI